MEEDAIKKKPEGKEKPKRTRKPKTGKAPGPKVMIIEKGIFELTFD
jgi:hypothetical protein